MVRVFLVSLLTLGVISGLLFFGPLSDLYGDSNGVPGTKITLAPIHEVDILIGKSNPEHVLVYIKGGLADACTTFKDIQTQLNGNIINITVTVQRPEDAICAQVYGYFEKNIPLGTDFIRGKTYIVNVNDMTTSFTYPKSNTGPDIEISLAPIHEVDILIAESFPEQIFVYIKGGLPDGCTTFNSIRKDITGNTINVTVTVQKPRGAICPAIYTLFEKTVSLGSDFKRGEAYTVNVNGTTISFVYPK